MTKINWDEFKEYKRGHSKAADNFLVLLNFMQSYYNMLSVNEIYETLSSDDLALMMLKKRDLKDAVALEKFLYNRRV
ncbi:MAG: hypothetical protein COB17_03855 [Sulfurimonas sp.]|nr:MAG: hypothetical protein COB17_03855 [Sulfurimonas sp.]